MTSTREVRRYPRDGKWQTCKHQPNITARSGHVPLSCQCDLGLNPALFNAGFSLCSLSLTHIHWPEPCSKLFFPMAHTAFLSPESVCASTNRQTKRPVTIPRTRPINRPSNKQGEVWLTMSFVLACRRAVRYLDRSSLYVFCAV